MVTHLEITGLDPSRATGRRSHTGAMAFEITLDDESTERVDGADSYSLEGPLTTFYGNDRPRPLDSWSVKVASYRTDRITRIRRLAG